MKFFKLSVIYSIVAIILFLTALFFPNIIKVTVDENLNIFLCMLLSLHFSNSARIAKINEQLKETIEW